MSKQADEVYELLQKAFVHNTITREYYVYYKGQRLFFDFYIKDYDLLFEIQGQQHFEFVEHFHVDRQGFLEQKKRDSLKVEYCQKNEVTLVYINYDELLKSPQELVDKILKFMTVYNAAKEYEND